MESWYRWRVEVGREEMQAERRSSQRGEVGKEETWAERISWQRGDVGIEKLAEWRS